MDGFSVQADWDRLVSVAVVTPEHFAITSPVNATQRLFYSTALAPTRDRLLRQHRQFCDLVAAEGVEVVQVPSAADAPLQFNVRDAAAVIGKHLVLSRMVPSLRWSEPAMVRDFLDPPEVFTPASGHLEGGDIIVTPENVFVGRGQRTDDEGLAGLRELLSGVRGVIPVPLNPDTLHLDVAMTLLGPGLGVIHRPSVAGRLPAALRHVQWLEIDDEEVGQQAANVLMLDRWTALVDSRHDRLRSGLAGHGIRCLPVDIDEITKVGGGVRCLTLPLVRTTPAGPSVGGTGK
ncbi:dimethylarginine dimethylaminohydrolase family protein [Streptomyces sp. NPDC086549]|uniref:dimethylarginine dimethylaminohydrolase family protein n=1 Tax=Streptomyces sp. NPDC086549 TaxID=3365752 RepID=UPI003829B1C2